MDNPSMTEEEMLRAYEAFMLGGSGQTNESNTDTKTSQVGHKKKKGRKGRNQDTLSSNISSPRVSKTESITNQNIASISKIEKQIWSLFHSFCKTVQNNWVQIDDQIVNVVSSIENIQTRVPKEMKLISKIMKSDKKASSMYRSFGNSVGFLNLEDIQLALSHDLLQHEKMVAALRKLVSDLSESLQMIGRQLNDVQQLYQESSFYLFGTRDRSILTTIEQEEKSISLMKSLHLIDEMNDIYFMLSRETYRKQCFSISLLDSIDDSVLTRDNAATDAKGSIGVRKAVSSKVWSRTSKHSCLDTQRFESFLKKGKLDPV